MTGTGYTLDAAERRELVAAFQASMRSFTWSSKVDRGVAELSLPGHTSVFTKRARRTSWFKRRKAEATLYEPATVHAVSFLVRSAGIGRFFDVGASDGFFSLIAASVDRAPPAVDAFEMAPLRIPSMESSRALNPGLAVTAHNIALSDHALGMTRVWYYKNDLFLQKPERADYDEGFSRKIKYYLRGETERLRLHEAQIAIETVDSFRSKTGRPPDLLKIDVDGYEGKVLRGASETLSVHKPYILLELHRNVLLAPHGTDRRRVVKFLLERGYRALVIRGHTRMANVQMFEVALDHMEFCDENSTDLILFY